jgi:maltose alpha-D-glucosyltransferase/alpha-amylase
MTAAATKVFLEDLRRQVPLALPEFLPRQRWFGGKARSIHSVNPVDVVPLPPEPAFILLVEVRYLDGPEETYVLPLVVSDGTSTGTRGDTTRVFRMTGTESKSEVLLCDALQDQEFLYGMLDAIARGLRFAGGGGEIRAACTSALGKLSGPMGTPLLPHPLRAEQSNTSINYGDRMILKFFRRLQEGINPDLEIGRFLTEQAHFPHVPAVAGSLEYWTHDGRQMTLGILQGYAPNQGNAWEYALRTLRDFYERVESSPDGPGNMAQPRQGGLLVLADQDPSSEALGTAGPFLGAARILGERTAQLHLALASATTDPAFTPEPFTPAVQQGLEESMRDWTVRTLGLLRQKMNDLPERWHASADKIAASEEELLRRSRSVLAQSITAMRTRIHGDYHLGQVLYTGSDFVIIDFEGEPARSIEERRVKRSPLQDVAGMLRSFHYAAYASLLGPATGRATGAENSQRLEVWAERWWDWMSGCFLRAYRETSGASCHIPRSREEFSALLELHLLEKAVYELHYELNNRPEWVGIPLRGISTLLASKT